MGENVARLIYQVARRVNQHVTGWTPLGGPPGNEIQSTVVSFEAESWIIVRDQDCGFKVFTDVEFGQFKKDADSGQAFNLEHGLPSKLGYGIENV